MTATLRGLAARARSSSGDDILRLEFLPRDNRDLGEEAGAGPSTSDRYRQVRNALTIILLLLSWRDPERWVAYSRDRNAYRVLGRYSGRLMSYQSMVWAVNTLDGAGLVDHRKSRPGSQGRYRSTLRASHKLRDLSPISHIAQIRSVIGEPIRLKDEDKRLVLYRDTREIRSWRGDVIEQNDALASVHVSLASPRWHVDRRGLLRQGERVVNPALVHYYRVWNRDFLHGGRWYCPSIQGLPSNDRAHLLIDGMSTVELDYRHLHPTLLAAIANIDMGAEDPYVIAGTNRKDVKLALNILLNAETENSATRALQLEFARMRYPTPAHSARRLLDVIKSRHPLFEFAWGTGIGLRLQNIDATMCAEVQRLMRRKGHPVLSVHDSYVAAASLKSILEDVMSDVLEQTKSSLKKNGLDGP